MITKKINACLLGLSAVAMVTLTSCIGMSEPRVSKPLATDFNEIHWRMYYEDQYDAYGQAVPPGGGDPDVAWTAYYSEKNAYAIRETNALLKEQLQRERDRND